MLVDTTEHTEQNLGTMAREQERHDAPDRGQRYTT
jgi:hypothetical protein